MFIAVILVKMYCFFYLKKNGRLLIHRVVWSIPSIWESDLLACAECRTENSYGSAAEPSLPRDCLPCGGSIDRLDETKSTALEFLHGLPAVLWDQTCLLHCMFSWPTGEIRAHSEMEITATRTANHDHAVRYREQPINIVRKDGLEFGFAHPTHQEPCLHASTGLIISRCASEL